MAKKVESKTSVFVDIANTLNLLPDEIKDLYERITIDTVNKYFDRMERELDQKGGKTLADKRVPYPPIYAKGKVYVRRTDWTSEIVDKKWGSEWGRKKKRAAGKRNFSLRPATYHDLAYIINYGHDGIAGTYFIANAWRRFRGWKGARNRKFHKEVNKLKGR